MNKTEYTNKEGIKNKLDKEKAKDDETVMNK